MKAGERIDWRPTLVSAAKASHTLLEGAPEDMMAEVASQAGKLAAQEMAANDPHFKAVPVCAEGCVYCCYQAVVATTPEVVWIAKYLRETLDEKALAALATRLSALASETATISLQEWHRRHTPCPMLDVASGSCTVHEARPMTCRAHNSLDVFACSSSFEAGDVDAKIPMNVFQKGAFEASWLGSMAAMAEAGKDTEVYDLTQALVLALADPAVGEAWARGERPLASARVPRTLSVTQRFTPLYQPGRKALRVVR